MILFILIHIAAAYYNYYCILGQGTQAHDRQWHKWQALFNSLIALFIALYVTPYFAIQFLFTRMVFFQSSLNLIRGKGFFYIGKNGIDGMFGKVFGSAAGVVYFILGIVLIVGMYFLHLYVDIMNVNVMEAIKEKMK